MIDKLFYKMFGALDNLFEKLDNIFKKKKKNEDYK
jgi:hypothetical protein